MLLWIRRWIFQNTIAAEFMEAVAKESASQERKLYGGDSAGHDASDAAVQSLSEMLFF